MRGLNLTSWPRRPVRCDGFGIIRAWTWRSGSDRCGNCGHRLGRRGDLAPLKIQQEIVKEIEAKQRVIDGARTVVENYRPYNSIDPD